MLQHVAAEVDVTAQDLIGALTRVDHFETGIADRATQEEFGDTVPVPEKRFGMKNCVGEIVGYVRLFDRNGMKIRARQSSHFRGNGTFVIVFLIERKRERLNWSGGVSRRKSEHCARIDPATEVTTDRDVSAHPQAHRLLKHMPELFDPRLLAPLALDEFGRRAV